MISQSAFSSSSAPQSKKFISYFATRVCHSASEEYIMLLNFN